MKKLLLLIAVIFSIQTANAQSTSHKKGDNLLNVGVGLGYYNYGFVGNRTLNLPAFTANFELGVHDYFGVGPFVGFKSWGYRDNNNVNYRFNLFAAGARASFHYLALLNDALELGIDDQQWDFYITLHLGIENRSYTADLQGLNPTTIFIYRPAAGFRYYLSPDFGLYAEGGYGALSFLTVGATLKL